MEDRTFKINIRDMEWSELTHGDRISHRRKDFTRDFKTNKMVASLYEIPPGKVSWPFHYHIANEEIFFILDGTGELRTRDGTMKVIAGDFLRFPVGEGGLHQLKNTSSDKSLKYLDFGTTNQPDLVFMPDSNKVGIFGGGAPCQNKEIRFIWKYFDLDTEIDYFKDE
jgi:uncharacterized cupin superfamily protein